MRSTAPRLVRILPRSALKASEKKIVHQPAPQFEDLKKPSTIDLLLQQKIKAGSAWPSNIRIEPVITNDVFRPVRPELRSWLKRLLKET